MCLCVLREPYLVDCCGYSFCRSCIEMVKSENKPCPLCAVQFTTCIPDKRLQRTLNDFQVYCAHKEDGCEWVGSLGTLTQHLNAKPLGEGERLSGCQLTSIVCKHCFDHTRRQDMVKHETFCPQRPYSCDFCDNFTSTFEDVTFNHLPICPDRPVSCPNGCELSPKAKLLEDHLKECYFEVIECPFSYAGCTERLSRQSMPEHITQRLALHMSLQSVSHQQEMKKLNSRISELETQLEAAVKSQEHSRSEVAQLKIANQLLLDRIQQEYKSQVASISRDLKTAQELRLKGHLGTLRGEIKRAQAETKQKVTEEHLSTIRREIKKAQCETKQEVNKQMNAIIQDIHTHIRLVPFTVTVPDFKIKKQLGISWYSLPFYTHPHGYKMCLNVDANGYGEGRNNHVSVFVFMKKGDYDEQLKWPFRGCITIRVLNQAGDDEGHLTSTLDITADDTDFGRRIILEEQTENGWGFHKLIPHEQLPQFLNNSCLCLQIKAVKF